MQNSYPSPTETAQTQGGPATSSSKEGIKAGDRFIWLHSENDHRFGETCEVVAVRGDKVDYKFVNRPTWKEATMPLSWVNEKDYSQEEILEVRMRNKKRRRFRDF